MDVFVNSKPFETVFSDYIEKNAKVKIADELNKRAANIIMKAMANTPRVTADEIKKDLGVMFLQKKGIVKTGKRAGQLKKGTQKFYKPDPNSTKVFKIFNWRRKNRPYSLPKDLRGQPSGNIRIKGMVNDFVNAARKTGGYIAAGWLPALNAIRAKAGIKISTANDPSKELTRNFKNIGKKSLAGRGYAEIANPKDVVMKCTFGNAARGANIIGKDALIRAINAEIQDMKIYIEGKILGLSGKEITALTKRAMAKRF